MAKTNTESSAAGYSKPLRLADLKRPVRLTLRELPPDIRGDVEERAAIMEFDGGLTREEAEEQALEAHQKDQR
jgi:hypothetical protein